MSVRPWQIVVFLCMVLLASTSGQTTQPTSTTPQGWNDLIGKVGNLLCEDPTPPTLSDFISDDLSIRELGNSGSGSRYRLQEKTAGTSIISIHAYAWPAATVASDLAADIKQFDTLPDALRKQFALQNDSDTSRANTIAQQWINGVLQPGDGQFVAVLLLWDHPATPGNVMLGTPSDAKQPLFVLIKGSKSDDDQFHITQISYGDARQALN